MYWLDVTSSRWLITRARAIRVRSPTCLKTSRAREWNRKWAIVGERKVFLLLSCSFAFVVWVIWQRCGLFPVYGYIYGVVDGSEKESYSFFLSLCSFIILRFAAYLFLFDTYLRSPLLICFSPWPWNSKVAAQTHINSPANMICQFSFSISLLRDASP